MADTPKTIDSTATKVEAAAVPAAKPVVTPNAAPSPIHSAASVQPAKPAPAAAQVAKPVVEAAKPAEVATPAAVTKPAPVAAAPEAKTVPAKAKPARKLAAKKPAVKKIAAKRKPAAAAKSATKKPRKNAAAKPAAKPITRKTTKLKENIMATKNNDFAAKITANVNNAVGDLQNRTKVAYDKSSTLMTEMGDFAKGNVEAMVESGKIFAGGVEAISKNYVAEAKTAYATLSADMKEMAAVKSPTELFQLQGKIVRRNFDLLVATSTKNNDGLVKLANEAFAPISGRVNLAAAKLSKAA